MYFSILICFCSWLCISSFPLQWMQDIYLFLVLMSCLEQTQLPSYSAAKLQYNFRGKDQFLLNIINQKKKKTQNDL